ncbi:BREX-2 system adenine-specific DNA-methyltransferase PglX [Mycobacterium xenopi]|uniref:site-specific DNA-methyltransferase (adenine-specific) n=1 Tax=Mycobacterium xenopi TaxID=1789 RepID=A0AAD1H1X2_MYCXE|nr:MULTISPECIES: BREX-2 system adenine-specific DNA-methyltransferase PglX [Mycobacterium]MDA3637893.1 BREX-2 system adenine-specific DNA-methyltransferase PglX [Mycobacterium xenopi]MDA3660720.1 BREX-2 system adenine-specific DNA-methyltransferase PglX [Mycobacterium xenopi]ORX09349.1 DNA methylase [Mycobacterium xenopi]PIJ34890.1 SAM-dependent DNA methyltransferase [Mycobacterium heckeshornense]SPX88597.1 DNA methylase [Mycobacterium xenopi]
MTWAAADLVAALRRQVSELEADLRARVDGDDHDLRQPGVYEAWKRDYDAAFAAQRTASSWQQWRNDRVTQAAVAWVLVTVFARYCEDNALVTPRWVGGATGDERGHALDARRSYFQQHPEHTDREWLQQIIAYFGKFTATKGLVDEYSPLHLVAPSGDAARTLLEFWWQQSATGEPLYPFAGVDTRFLGDVYQDLSEHAKKTYALLQTPEFVEEFILDQTMEPALADRPLEGFTVIDPTCGSGHFLLGAFRRLHERWQRHAPGLGARELVEKALDGVYGVDINPFAVAIARFRLLVAALHAAGDTSIEEKIRYTPHLAAGDSLLWGANQQLLPEDLLAGPVIRADSTENADALKEILQREHDVVVGNPPYITVKDAALNTTYRQLYQTPHRKYALTVPFMELFFRLAYSSGRERPAGWVGQITSNSFMKREFGSKLIEEFLPTVDLRVVIDTSGAYIPGHGTPTAILVGRNQRPSTETIRAVLGIRGEPGRPADAAKGLVWSTIVEHVDQPGHEDAYVSVADVPRSGFGPHPWSLSGGGAVELSKAIEDAGSDVLGSLIMRIGFFGVMGADDAFSIPSALFASGRFDNQVYPLLIQGDDVRDYTATAVIRAFFPYDDGHQLLSLESFPDECKRLWRVRTELGNRATFSRGTYFSDGRAWHEWHQLPIDAGASPLSITFAFVATHNHFVLDHGGKVFKQSAPVIKLPASATVEDHLRLLGVLNSSVACFWLKQNSHNKGNGGIGGGIGDEDWEPRYEFTGTTLKDFPLPATTPLERAKLLDDLAQAQQQQTPVEVAARQTPAHAVLEAARSEFARLRGLMIAHQEELDWEYYRIYGLIDNDLTYGGDVPEIALGERAFEIALARRMKDGEETAWFERHGSTPVTEIPQHLPADYRDLLQRRLDAIDSNPHIRLLERPEYKRRWAMEPWDKQVQAALKDWLLDRVEDRALWYDREGRPTVLSVAQLADILDRNEEFRRVLRLWAGDQNVPTGAALAKLLADEAVPFLAAYRYKPSGLDKRAAWEHTWALQRREDAGEKIDAPIPVPPKYTSADFAKPSYWSHRGKLDVPKERFISYPNAGRESDTTELLGWAGWDHADQALALAALISQRIEDGWDTPRLIPLLAGLHELLPWVRQWHNEIDPEYGESVADTIDDELTARLAEHHLTVTDLTAWRPEPTRRTRRAATS